jgi:branched-chain amino acid transport system permease protein
MITELAVTGLSNGASIALLAVAFYLAYCVARTFHLALAGIYALVPYVTWELQHRGIGLAVSAAIATAVGCAVSVLCEYANHGPLRRRLASSEAHLLSSLGLYVVIVQVVLVIWGPEAKILRPGLEPIYAIGSLTIRRSQLIALSTALASLMPFWLCLKLTPLGIILRAFRDSPAELALLGFNTALIRRFLFAGAGIYCALAAVI